MKVLNLALPKIKYENHYKMDTFLFVSLFLIHKRNILVLLGCKIELLLFYLGVYFESQVVGHKVT